MEIPLQLFAAQSRAEHKLTAGNQPARSLLASDPGGTRGHIFVGCRDLCVFFSPSLILLNNKEEGVGLFFFSRCFLTTP
jgi:hypothetical protein